MICREWHQNFREECPEGLLDKDHIMKIYDEISPFGNSKDFVEHIFRIFDKDGDGTIDFKEFMLATDMTASGTPEEKLRWAFKVSKIIFIESAGDFSDVVILEYNLHNFHSTRPGFFDTFHVH